MTYGGDRGRAAEANREAGGECGLLAEPNREGGEIGRDGLVIAGEGGLAEPNRVGGLLFFSRVRRS